MVTNLKEVFAKFSDEEVCRQYLIKQRWNGCPECPHCGSNKWYSIEGGKRFKCGNNTCYKKYSVTVGTIFHASNIPLTTWFPAMYILTAHKKGISSVQLAKDLGVTQKTAWFMMHRVRESLKDKKSDLLTGTVEIDETYMSRKYASDYKAIPPEEVEQMETTVKKNNKGAVIGMKQRDGKVIVLATISATAEVIGDTIKDHVAPDAHLMSDEALKYKRVLADYKRDSVNHSAKEWVRNTDEFKVHTNGIENFWSVMKRGVYGIYHQISFKHLQRYCDEFSYRYNSRTTKDGERFLLSLQHIEGRLSYKQLVYGESKKSGEAEEIK